MGNPPNAAGETVRSETSAFAADLRIAQLMCSRFCHDLVGPAGAVNAGAEFLAGSAGVDDGTRALLKESGRQLTRRLAFFRVAFGLAGGSDGVLTLTEARELAAGMFSGGRIELDWPLVGSGTDPQAPRPLNAVRLVLCQVLIAAGALPRGGRLEVRFGEQGRDVEARVSAFGRDAGFGNELLATIRSAASVADLTARTVHGYFAARLAERLGTMLRIEDGEGSCRIMATLPATARIKASAA